MKRQIQRRRLDNKAIGKPKSGNPKLCKDQSGNRQLTKHQPRNERSGTSSISNRSQGHRKSDEQKPGGIHIIPFITTSSKSVAQKGLTFLMTVILAVLILAAMIKY